MAGMSTPRQVRSVEVTNTSDKPISVTVTYDMPSDSMKKIRVNIDIDANKSFWFREQVVSMGSYEAYAFCTLVTVTNSSNVTVKLPLPAVSGIVAKQAVSYTSSGSLKAV